MKSAKITETQSTVQYEHPDDKAMRLRAEKLAAKRIGEFVSKNEDRISQLILLFSDAQSDDLLRRLREEFWSKIVTIS